MPVDRPPRAPSSHITPQIAQAIFKWLRDAGYGLARIVDLYLQAEVYADPVDALIELEDRYALTKSKLLDDYTARLAVFAQNMPRPSALRGIPIASLRPEDLIHYLGPESRAEALLQSLPEPELLTALELVAHSLADEDAGNPDLFSYLEKAFRRRGLPYIASADTGISWVGEPAVREQAIEPALSVLADPRLSTARDEFDKARGHVRRGEFKDAGKAAGDAVETTMAIMLDAHGHPQPQTAGGHDLVQAGALFDALKAKSVRLLDEEREYALIFGPIKVRHTCGHGTGISPKPPDPAYVEAGVAAAAIAITYLATKLP
jgi:hypothetical protein